MQLIGLYIDKIIMVSAGLYILLYFIPKRKKEIEGKEKVDSVLKIQKHNKLLTILAYALILFAVVQISIRYFLN